MFVDPNIMNEDVENKEHEVDTTKRKRNIPGNNRKYRNFLEIIDTFYKEKEIVDIKKTEEINNQVHIEPKIIYSDYNKQLKINFKLGIKQLYRLKSLSEFYSLMKDEKEYRYGSKLAFIHKEEAFLEEDRILLKYILEQAEIIKVMNSYNKSYYTNTVNDSEIILTPSGLDRIFDMLEDKEVEFESSYVTTKVKFVDNKPDIYFKIENVNDKECKISPNIEVYNNYTILEGKNYTYFLMNNKLYRCDHNVRETTLMLLEVFRKNLTEEIIFPKEYLTSFYNIVMPKLEGEVRIEDKELDKIKQYIPEKLGVKMFLDMDQRGYITAEIRFCYGNIELNPLMETEENIQEQLARNTIEERDIIIDITNSGFRLDEKNKILVMPNNDDIYDFLSFKIEDYMRRFEVLATENIRNKQIRQPKIGTIGVKIENNLLNIDLSQIQIDKEELKQILRKYNMKKKYHRLKDGSFISIEENGDLEFINNLLKGMDLEEKEIEKNMLRLPIYRSMYLEKLLEKVENIEVKKNQNYATMVHRIEKKGKEDSIQIPKSIEGILRYYQKTGYNWLKTIDEYQFGGILADDMGLRKNRANISNYIRIHRKNRKREKTTITCGCSKFACTKLEKRSRKIYKADKSVNNARECRAKKRAN